MLFVEIKLIYEKYNENGNKNKQNDDGTKHDEYAHKCRDADGKHHGHDDDPPLYV